MTGIILVDGVNIFTEYGVFVTTNGYNGLLSFPPLKTPNFVDWAERDGIEVDLSNPVLDSKTFQIAFSATANNSDIGGLMVLLENQSYHTISFQDLNISKILRLVSGVSYTGFLGGIRFFDLEFADDFPIDNTIYRTHSISTVVPLQGYALDGIDMSRYGIFILEGTQAEMLKSPAIKQQQTVNIQSLPGLIYDGGIAPVYKQKDVKLNLLMKCTNVAQFHTNWNGLIYKLITPGLKHLSANSLGMIYPKNLCHYKNSEIIEFILRPNGQVFCQFSLTLVFTAFRPSADYINYIPVGTFPTIFDNTFL